MLLEDPRVFGVLLLWTRKTIVQSWVLQALRHAGWGMAFLTVLPLRIGRSAREERTARLCTSFRIRTSW